MSENYIVINGRRTELTEEQLKQLGIEPEKKEKNPLGKVITDLIREYWGAHPIYYTDSENEEEAGAAKLCCKILEVIRMQ